MHLPSLIYIFECWCQNLVWLVYHFGAKFQTFIKKEKWYVLSIGKKDRKQQL